MEGARCLLLLGSMGGSAAWGVIVRREEVEVAMETIVGDSEYGMGWFDRGVRALRASSKSS